MSKDAEFAERLEAAANAVLSLLLREVRLETDMRKRLIQSVLVPFLVSQYGFSRGQVARFVKMMEFSPEGTGLLDLYFFTASLLSRQSSYVPGEKLNSFITDLLAYADRFIPLPNEEAMRHMFGKIAISIGTGMDVWERGLTDDRAQLS